MEEEILVFVSIVIFLGVNKSMYKCLLWGAGKEFASNTQLIKFYEQRREIEVVGITSNEKIYSNVLGWCFIPKNYISDYSIDVVVVMMEEPDASVYEEIYNSGFGYENVLNVKVLTIPEFTFERYLRIKANPPTIFSPMCWGGVTYHSLCMRFESPFINMFLFEDDYMKFLDSPKSFIECDLKFKKTGWNEIMKKEYPVADCDGIELHFNHYDSFEEARNIWEKRKQRINWDNILVMMFTDSQQTADEFLKKHYLKKILFTSFEINDKNAVYLNLDNYSYGTDLWTAVNDIAKGRYLNYDVLKLMKDGEVSFLTY